VAIVVVDYTFVAANTASAVMVAVDDVPATIARSNGVKTFKPSSSEDDGEDYRACLEACVLGNRQRPGVVNTCSASDFGQHCPSTFASTMSQLACELLCGEPIPAGLRPSQLFLCFARRLRQSARLRLSYALSRLSDLVIVLSARRVLVVLSSSAKAWMHAVLMRTRAALRAIRAVITCPISKL